MNKLASIVEGDGEVAALPVLLRRLSLLDTPTASSTVLPPIRVRRDRFLNREEEFARHLLLAGAKCGEAGWVLVLLDADDDCPVSLGATILKRSRTVLPHRRVSVVLANREYESWFIAAAKSLDGHRGFVHDGQDEPDPDRPRNAKEWIERRMSSHAYRETTDQAAFSAVMDLDLARQRSRSFRKLCAEWHRQVTRPEPTSGP